MLKNIKIILGLILTLLSCEKNELYVDGGVLPYTPPKPIENNNIPSLVGTTWVLTYICKEFATQTPYDTIKFLHPGLSINGSHDQLYGYGLTQTMDVGAPLNLILSNFLPFSSGGIWSTTLVNTFIKVGEINLAEFTRIGTSQKIIASFKRIE